MISRPPAPMLCLTPGCTQRAGHTGPCDTSSDDRAQVAWATGLVTSCVAILLSVAGILLVQLGMRDAAGMLALPAVALIGAAATAIARFLRASR